MTKRLLFLHRQTPGLRARESLDAVLVGGVFDQQVSLLFREQGVQQLIASSETDEEWLALLRSLPDYGIDAIYVCAGALREHGVDPASLVVPARVLSASEQSDLLGEQDMVLTD
jgi:tRNA 2-thiouridine synthesizing protein C